MYRTELIKAMLKKTEEHKVPLTVKQMDTVLTALVEAVTDALKKERRSFSPASAYLE